MIELHSVTFAYHEQAILDRCSLTLAGPHVVSIVGPSGCGKTTLLRLIAGVEVPVSGLLRVHGETPRPGAVFYSFQDFDAFPWFTVRENLELCRSVSTKDGMRELEAARKVGLQQHLHKYPRELSGGLRKRLALARALCSGHRTLLLDEPFSSLDIIARGELQELLHDVVRDRDLFVVIITHDIEESVSLSRQILICSGPPLGLVRVFSTCRQTDSTAMPFAQSVAPEIRETLRGLQADVKHDPKERSDDVRPV